ncbi:MAG: hypothetical protein EOP11_23350 [Proteobacteria bacterium]|nr:MAG: hypothetical protein EOP11_23350 [Pseudomonadota bacterium]
MSFLKKAMRSWFSLQEGPAHRVIFYYQGEDPTFLEDAFVTLFRNGVVEVKHRNEHVSTHVQNVEISWKHGDGQNLNGILGGKIAGTGRALSLVKNDVTSPIQQ